MRPPGIVIASLLVLGTLVGWGLHTRSAHDKSMECSAPADAQLAQKYEGTLALLPDRVRPGDEFVALFPDFRSRSAMLFMDIGSWHCWTYAIYDDGPVPHWQELPHEGDGQITTLSIFERRDRIRAVVPEVAPPGTYRICDDTRKACALLHVVE